MTNRVIRTIPINTEKLKALLAQKDISVNRLSKAIGYSDRNVRLALHNGVCSPSMALELCYFLGLQADNSIIDLSSYISRLKHYDEVLGFDRVKTIE